MESWVDEIKTLGLNASCDLGESCLMSTWFELLGTVVSSLVEGNSRFLAMILQADIAKPTNIMVTTSDDFSYYNVLPQEE
jgi:hypothetical protein